MIDVSPSIFSLKNIYQAYKSCRTGKREAVNTRDFEVNLYAHLRDIHSQIQTEQYQPSRSVCFYVTKPKLREIFAADFKDRVVHRLLVDALEPFYEKKFIFDSYACRKNKGTHAAVQRLKAFLQKITKGGRGQGFFLQLDIKGFFMEIQKQILINILQKNIKPGKIMTLCQAVIQHNPTDNYIVKGRMPERGILPPHKTLFHTDRDRGIPIGNLTSQFFANIYLNELDQYIKRGLGVRYYLRYVDDFILLDQEPDQLLRWRGLVIDYLSNHLSLQLKDSTVMPKSVYHGIDFLGYIIRPRCTLIRRRVVQSARKALSQSLPVEPQSGHFMSKELQELSLLRFHRTVYHGDWKTWRALQSRMNSFFAHFLHGDSFRLRQSMEKKINQFRGSVSVEKKYIRLRPASLQYFSSLKQQVYYFLRLFPHYLLIVKVGRVWEIYGERADDLGKIAKIKSCMRNNGMKTYSTRSARPDLWIKLAHQWLLPYLIIKQTDEISDRVKVRFPIFRGDFVLEG